MLTPESTRPDDDPRPSSSLGVDYLRQVWHRRKWVALFAFCATAAAVTGVIVSLPNLYRATATVLVDRQEVSEAFVRPSVTAELDTRIRTIHEQITSRQRLSTIITRYNLYPELRKAAPMDAAVDAMRKDVELKLKGVDQPNGRIETISFGVTYTGRDPQLVADVTNTLVGSYIAENAQSRERQASGTAEVLEQQVKEAGKTLDSQDRRTTAFTSEFGDQLVPQLGANMAALDRVAGELRDNADAQLRASDRRERIEQDAAAAEAGRGTGPETPNGRLLRLKNDLAELRRNFYDSYPDVVRLQNEVNELQKQVDAINAQPKPVNPALAEIDSELKLLKSQEAELKKTQAMYEARIAATPTRQRELEDLTRGHDSQREHYQALVKQYTDARLAASLEQGQRLEQFRVLDPAVPPRIPSAPDRMLLGLFGLALCIGIALVTVFIAEKTDSSFHTADELGSYVNVPVLATIRYIPTRATARSRRWKEFFATCAALVALALIGAGAFYLAQGNEQIVKMTARGGN